MQRSQFGWLRHAIDSAKELVYPPQCVGCGVDTAESGGQTLLCPTCREMLTDDAQASCPRCAAPLPQALSAATDCSHCRGEKFAFARVVALGVYQGPLQAAVLQLKQPTGESLALEMARRLAERVAAQISPLPEVAAPVPRHWMRRLARGANCAELLADAAARELQLPCLPDLLKARRWRPQQHLLLPAQRRANMRGAFQVRPGYDMTGARVLLVDDALTTGATAHAAAVALSRAGAAEVIVAVVARGIGV